MSDKNTLADTFMKYRSKLMRAVSAIVSKDDIEDIVQEAFVKSYEAQLDHNIEYQRTYMLRTVRNLALNHVTSAASILNDPIENMDALPYELVGHTLEKNVESKERFLQFCRATDTLSSDVKRVFLLKKIYGMKQKEIAELLGLSQSTVEKHVAKGLLMCTKYMAALNEDVGGDVDTKSSQDVRSQ
ncbi:RNA polymerase sigma factor [Salinimonas chungwhensis]|uniref:RNA polymerase sigma factor n=1 Tax=Salinimonas chungwhensis TaxID=265425 RepID=UPI0003803B7C